MRTGEIVTSSALSPAKARTRAVMVFALYRSEHVRTLFESTQSQESKSDLGCVAELVIAGAPAGLGNLSPYTMQYFKM